MALERNQRKRRVLPVDWYSKRHSTERFRRLAPAGKPGRLAGWHPLNSLSDQEEVHIRTRASLPGFFRFVRAAVTEASIGG